MADTLAPAVSAEELAAMAELDAQIDGARPESAPEPEAKPEPAAKAEEQPAEPADPAETRDYEAEARADGWTSKEEWIAAGKDPEKHRDAKTFVELADNDPAILRRKYTELKAQNEDFQRRTSAATKAQIERAEKEAKQRYEQQITDLEKQRDDLIDRYAGDPQAIRQINQNFEAAKSEIPDASIAQAMATARANWVSKYPQYESSPVFQGASNAAMERIIAEETEADWRQAGTPAKLQEMRFEKLEKQLVAEGLIKPQQSVQEPNPAPPAPPANSRTIDGARTIQTRDTRTFESLPPEAKAMFKTLEADGIKLKKEDFAKDYYNG